jgi:hypothetical protein
LNAGSFGPNPLDGTFGPEVMFQKAAPVAKLAAGGLPVLLRAGDRRAERCAEREPARYRRRGGVQPDAGALAAGLMPASRAGSCRRAADRPAPARRLRP